MYVVAESDSIARLLHTPIGYIVVVMRRREWEHFKCYRCFVAHMMPYAMMCDAADIEFLKTMLEIRYLDVIKWVKLRVIQFLDITRNIRAKPMDPRFSAGLVCNATCMIQAMWAANPPHNGYIRMGHTALQFPRVDVERIRMEQFRLNPAGDDDVHSAAVETQADKDFMQALETEAMVLSAGDGGGEFPFGWPVNETSSATNETTDEEDGHVSDTTESNILEVE